MTQTTVDLFVNAIRDPHDPRLCGSCLIGCLEKIFPNSQRNLGVSRRRGGILSRNHDVWNALILFITTKRTNKQMQRVLTCLSQCSCQLAETHMQELHRVGGELRPRLLGRSICEMDFLEKGTDLSGFSLMVMGSCFSIEIFSLLAQVLPDVGVVSFAKGLTFWPKSPAELLPLGTDLFITAMLQWHDVLNDSIVFAVCGLTLRLCGDVLVPSLISYLFCNQVVKAGRALFDEYMVYLVAEDSSIRGLHCADVFALQLHGIQIFLQVLYHQEMDRRVLLVRGYETKLCQLCALFLHVTTDPRYTAMNSGSNGFPGFVYCGQDLYRLFHMHLPPRPLIPLHPEIVEFDEECFPPAASIRSPPERSIFGIKHYKTENRCSGLNCFSSLQSVGRNFQRCARCNIVPYCGRECQTQDWKNETFPHKMVCSILQDLVRKGGGWVVFSGSRAAITPLVLMNWKASGVSDADLQYVDGWVMDREKRKNLPDGSEWTPGFDDYDSIIWQFGKSGVGPKPRYPNRLARWPSEVAKVKALLEVLPFWEQEIV